MKIYMAGSLFSEGEVFQRKHEYNIITKALPKAEIFSPIMADFNTDKTNTLPTAKEIFWGDFREIESSNYVIFDLGNQLDPGLNGELGLIAGLNHSNRKPIIPIGILSDIRLGSANQYDIPPFSMNHFQLGLIEAQGSIVNSLEEAISLIKKTEGIA